MNVDYKRGIIDGMTWESVQERVRDYAGRHDLEVSPKWGIPLEMGCEKLYLFKKGGLICVAEFSPYFRRDATTLKYVRTEYFEDPSITDLLADLGIRS